MSVKIGFPNSKYNLTNLNNHNQILVLNSSNDPNIILLNDDIVSSDDTLINFKNKISTGLLEDNFVIHDVQNATNIIEIDQNKIDLNKNVLIAQDIKVNDIFNTSNGTITMYSNIDIYLIEDDNNFNVLSCNNISKVYFKTNGFSITNMDNDNRILIDSSNTYISSNVYINEGGVLYVDKISSLRNSLSIENAIYNATTIESMSAINSLSVTNNSESPNTVALNIYKKYGSDHIINVKSFYSTSVNKTNLVLNNNGLLGINTNNPDSFITIKNSDENYNIINYDGTVSRQGNIFNITKQANVGIGTTNPKGQLHIQRLDDHVSDNDIRKDSMLLLDLKYTPDSNYSNIYQEKSSIFTINAVNDNGIKLINYSSEYDDTNKQLTNHFYILNNDILKQLGNGILNINNLIKIPNKDGVVFDFNITNNTAIESLNIIEGQDSSINIQNIIYYPKYYYTSSTNTIQNSIQFERLGVNYDTAINIEYHLYNNEENSGTEYNFVFSKTINYNTTIPYTIKLNMKILIENTINNKYIKYKLFEPVLVQPPKFMELKYNNSFISSLSHKGTLSLGKQSPETCNYLLYASEGNSYIDTLYVNKIDTEMENSNISFNFTNLFDIHNISNISMQSDSIRVKHIDILDTLYSSNSSFSNINVSNLSFEKCVNDNVSFRSTEINVNNLF